MKNDKNKNKILFFGNGINRCNKDEKLSSENIIKNLCKKNNIEYNKINSNENIPFTISFEIIANKMLIKHNKKNVYDTLKNDISKMVSIKNDQAINLFGKFTQLRNVFVIITTNYDNNIEKSIDNTFNENNIVSDKRNRYNLKKPYKVKDKYVYHIHGNILNSDSICLGYEHYAGTLQWLRTYVSKKNKKSELILSNKITKSYNFDYEKDIWAYKFFTNDIYIIGFGLDYAEIDVWWLITFRAYLLNSKKDKVYKFIKNKIVFYDVNFNGNLKMILENMSVEYRYINKKKDSKNINYYDAYCKIFHSIKSDIK